MMDAYNWARKTLPLATLLDECWEERGASRIVVIHHQMPLSPDSHRFTQEIDAHNPIAWKATQGCISDTDPLAPWQERDRDAWVTSAYLQTGVQTGNLVQPAPRFRDLTCPRVTRQDWTRPHTVLQEGVHC
jgi:hypothetical protein